MAAWHSSLPWWTPPLPGSKPPSLSRRESITGAVSRMFSAFTVCFNFESDRLPASGTLICLRAGPDRRRSNARYQFPPQPDAMIIAADTRCAACRAPDLLSLTQFESSRTSGSYCPRITRAAPDLLLSNFPVH
eukprot:750687-Hanusia_phi.AAC.1